MMTLRKNLVGKNFGNLIALKVIRRFSGIFYKCKCLCGKTTIVSAGHLSSGHTISCGCRRGNFTHGKSYSSTYSSWVKMKDRCLNPAHKHFEYYGGRGIKVCERWMKFENFLEDMGERPSGKTLDRKDSNGNYCKENCRWATKTQQQNNMRNNFIIQIEGVSKTISEWVRHFGSIVSPQVARLRISRGGNPITAFTKPRNRTWKLKQQPTE